MSDVVCQKCGAKCELFLCAGCQLELRQMLTDMPWWIARLQETAIGQARLGEPGVRRHRSGLEMYANPKPAIDGAEGTEGQRLLERDLADQKLRARLLSQGGVNAKASDLFDEVQNMLGSWVRDVCERRGVDVPTIGMAERMAMWLRERVSALASAECAGESFSDVKHAMEQMERAVNRPPQPKTCGPCPTLGHHREVDGKPTFDIDAGSRAKCGTRLEAKATATEVTCPVCKQTHDIEAMTDQLLNDLHYMSFTIRELLDVVLPRANEHIPRSTLYKWIKADKLKPSSHLADGTAKFILADVRRCRALEQQRKSA
jgi:hypothetical protein